MLRVTVGKSRKLSQDYNSTGFSITVDGEITALLDSPELVLEQVQILHDLASESLQDQVDRLKDPQPSKRSSSQPAANPQQPVANNNPDRPRWQTQNGHAQANTVAATNKQIQYLLNLGKQKGLSKVDLEASVAKQLNFDSVKSVYELSKSEATSAIDLIKA